MDEEEAKMEEEEEEAKTDKIIRLVQAKGDKGILDLMDLVWGDTIYDRLSAELGTMSEDEKEDILNEMADGGIPTQVLYVNKNKFVGWYLDEEMEEFVINKLIDKGEVILDDILQGVGYLPLDFIKNKEDVQEEDIDGEDKDEEIGKPGSKYRLEFK